MGIVLGPNQYGKAEVRLVHVDRATPRHRITDLTVTTQLRGDFSATPLRGDNAAVLATDTQKNTVYAFAREHGVGEPETFALLLGRHFLRSGDQIHGGRVADDAAPAGRAGPRAPTTRSLAPAPSGGRPWSRWTATRRGWSRGSRTSSSSSPPARSSTGSRGTGTPRPPRRTTRSPRPR